MGNLGGLAIQLGIAVARLKESHSNLRWSSVPVAKVTIRQVAVGKAAGDVSVEQYQVDSHGWHKSFVGWYHKRIHFAAQMFSHALFKSLRQKW